MKNPNIFKVGLVYSGFALAFGATAVSAADTPKGSQATALQEIVVTARNREENLQDVPIAIQAFGADELENLGIKSFRDVATRTPGMIFNDTAGVDHEIFVRGIGNTLSGAATENSFGVFIDGIYMPRSTGSQLPLFDLERAEVLKGPQSLRFGKNIVGGLIHYVTKKPTDTFEGSFEAIAGNYDKLDISGSVRGPISDTVKYSLTGITQAHDGYANNTNSDQDPQAIDRESLRGQLLFEPQDNLSVLLSADYNRARNTGRFDHIVESGDSAGASFIRFTTNPIPGLPADFVLPDRNVPFLDPDNREGPRNFTGYQNYDISGLSATVDWETDSGLALKSITSVRESEQDALDDSCGIYWDFPLVDVGQGMLIPDPGEAIRNADDVFDFLAEVPNCWLMVKRNEEVESFSQEFRLSGTAGDNIDWTVGAYYLDEDISLTRLQAFLFPDATVVKQFGGCRFGGPPEVCGPPTGEFGEFGPGGGLNEAFTASQATNYGVFAELTYAITDRLDLNVGVRWVRDDKDFTVRREGEALGQEKICQPDGMGVLPVGCDGEGVFRTSASDSWNEVLPEVSLTYALSDDATLYGRFAKGYKPGGWTGENSGTPQNALTTFEPEFSTTSEIGAKLLMADRRVRLNVAAHFTKYEDLQISQYVQFDDGRPSNIFVLNASDGTEAYGVEVDLTASVHEYLTLYTNYAYTECEFSGSIIIDSRGTDIDGNSCQRTPKNGVSVGANSRIPVSDSYDLTFGVDYQWKDEFYFNNLNTEEHLVDSDSMLNLRAGISSPDDVWDLQFWVNNATDEDNVRHMFVLWGSIFNTFQPPRTYGATFRRKF